MLDSVKRNSFDRPLLIAPSNFKNHLIAPKPQSFEKTKSEVLRANPFDTGEHIQIVDTAIPGLAKTLNIRGVEMTFGEISAMPDFYAAPSDLNTTETAKLSALLAAMRSGKSISESEWAKLSEHYFQLKENNNDHFALGKDGRLTNNRDSFRRYYSDGLSIAKVNPDQGRLYAAWSMHYLTDAFSSGHLFNKAEAMRAFDANMKNPQIQDRFFDQLAGALYADKNSKSLANYEVNGFFTNLLGFNWISGTIDTKEDIKKLLRGIYSAKPDMFANMSVAALHDSLNAKGVDVENDKGDVWHAYGDGQLSKSPQSIVSMQKAISIMNDEIERVKTGKAPLTTPEDVWSHVPRPTASSGQPFIDGEMKALTNPLNARLVGYIKSKAAEFMPTLIETLVAQGYLKRTGKKETMVATVRR